MGSLTSVESLRGSHLDIEVVDFRSLPYLLADEDDAFLLVLDPGGEAPELPVSRPASLRLRFHAPEGEEHVPSRHLEPFDSRHAEYVLRFLDRVLTSCRRIVVGSPEAEVRGPGVALGVADILRLPTPRVRALEQWYRWHSRAVRHTLWETAYPPQPVAAGPGVKAASGLLAFLSKYLSG